MKILAVSDVVVEWIYSPRIRMLMPDIEVAIGCGDLPSYYLEFIVSDLDIPLFHVNGNHSLPKEEGSNSHSDGTVNLHCRVMEYKGCIFAGIEGSLRYKFGPYQYTQMDMWLNVFRIIPKLLINRIKYGRYLDVFITHAPPWGIHDQSDLPHQGIKAFRWLDILFQPEYHLHGHIHIYRPDMNKDTNLGRTRVINVYGYRRIET